jgi:peptidoglycan hydrolase CwlO-like protein
MGVIQAEFRRISEEKAAAFVFVEKANKLAEESAQLADERQVAVDLLQSNITQLKTELTAFESQIDELNKEKSVLLYNATTWKATESQLQNEIVHLKSTIQTQNGILSYICNIFITEHFSLHLLYYAPVFLVI